MENFPKPLSLSGSPAIHALELKCHEINPPYRPKIETIPFETVFLNKSAKEVLNKDLRPEQPISRAYLAGMDFSKARFAKGSVFKHSHLRGAILPESLQSGKGQPRLEGCDLIDTETLPSSSLTQHNIVSRGSPCSALVRLQRPFFNVTNASLVHSGWVALAAFQDGCLACAQGHTIWIYDPRTRRVRRIIPGGRKMVSILTVVGDNLLASVGCYATSTHLWDIAKGERLHVLEGHHRHIMSLAAVGDGLLASGSDDRTVRIWEVSSGRLLQTLEGHRSGVCSLAVLGDGLLASGSEDKTIRIWDIDNGELLHCLEGHRWPVTSLARLEDGRLASAGSYDKTVRLWEPATGEHLDTFQIRQAAMGIVALGDGLLALKMGGKGLSIWDIDSGQRVHRLEGHTQPIHAIAAIGSGLVASASEDHTVRIWEAETGKEVHSLDSHRESFWSVVSVGTDSGTIAMDSKSNAVRLLETKTGKLLKVLKGHEKPIRGLTSLDGGLLASSSYDSTVCVWDVKTGCLIHTLRGHQEPVWTVEGLPNGLLASGSKDKTVCIWEARSGKLLHRLKGHQGSVWSLSALGDGLLASASNDKTIRIWDVASGKLLHVLKGHQASVRCLADAGNGFLVSGSNDKNVHIWELESGKLLHILKGHRDLVCSVAASKNDLIASGSEDANVCIWKIGSLEPLHVLSGHQNTVRSLTFCGGDCFASVSEDGTVRTWDAVSGRCLSLCYPLSDAVIATVIFEIEKGRSNCSAFSGIILSRADRPWQTTTLCRKVLPADSELDAFCGFLNENGHRMSVYDYPEEYGRAWYWDDAQNPYTIYFPWPQETSSRMSVISDYRKLFNTPDTQEGA